MCGRWDIHAISEVKVSIVKGPIFEGRAGEEGESIREVGKSMKHERVRGRGRFDVTSKSKVQGIDNHWLRNNRGVNIIQGSVYGITMRQGVGGGHLGTRKDFPKYIKVLEEEGPVSLALRQFVGVFDIGEVCVVGDDNNRV